MWLRFQKFLYKRYKFFKLLAIGSFVFAIFFSSVLIVGYFARPLGSILHYTIYKFIQWLIYIFTPPEEGGGRWW
jgi:hypothetical protein